MLCRLQAAQQMDKLGKIGRTATVKSSGCSGKQNTTQLSKQTVKEHMITICKYRKGANTKKGAAGPFCWPGGPLLQRSRCKVDNRGSHFKDGSIRLLDSPTPPAPPSLRQQHQCANIREYMHIRPSVLAWRCFSPCAAVIENSRVPQALSIDPMHLPAEATPDDNYKLYPTHDLLNLLDLGPRTLARAPPSQTCFTSPCVRLLSFRCWTTSLLLTFAELGCVWV